MKKIKRVPVTNEMRSSTSAHPPKKPGFVDQLIEEFYKPVDVFEELDEVPPVLIKSSLDEQLNAFRRRTSSSSAFASSKRPQIPQTVEIGAQCPRCGSFRHSVRTSRVNKAIHMKLPDGGMHQGVQFSYRDCLDCGQRYVVRKPA